MSKGVLYLFPTPIGEENMNRVIPEFNLEIIRTIKQFIAEDAKTARRFLKQCNYAVIQEAEIALLNEHTQSSSYSEFIKPLLAGHNVGLMSDAGCPGIADPGAEVVKAAHLHGIKVMPLVGPSSIVLTMMASGFNGQNFAFNGYLPIDKGARSKRIKELESLAMKHKQAQYFIETPYRNVQLFQELIGSLGSTTLVCLGVNLTQTNEMIITHSVEKWKKTEMPSIHKVPVVFGIYF